MGSDNSKRNYVRITDEFNVRIMKKDASGRTDAKSVSTSKSINISGSGLLIDTIEPIEVGAKLSITFLKPNSFDFFKGNGEVVRVLDGEDNTYKVAINFIDLTPEDKKTLNYYINLSKSK